MCGYPRFVATQTGAPASLLGSRPGGALRRGIKHQTFVKIALAYSSGLDTWIVSLVAHAKSTRVG